MVTLITVIFVKETPLVEKPTTPFWPPMIRVLGMLGGIAIGALAGLVGGGLVGGLAGLVTQAVTRVQFGWDFSGFPPLVYPTTLPSAIMIGVGGGVAMIVAVVIGVQAGCMGTLGKEARTHSSFVWWITNRLMFLAAATSLQGSLLYFVMFAFDLSSEKATSLSGTLTAVIGVFILLSALASGWLSDRLGRRRLVLASGILGAIGNTLLLVTIWVPELVIVYIAGTIIGPGHRSVHDRQLGARHGPRARGRSRALSRRLEPGRCRGGNRWSGHRRFGCGCDQSFFKWSGVFRRVRRLRAAIRVEQRVHDRYAHGKIINYPIEK